MYNFLFSFVMCLLHPLFLHGVSVSICNGLYNYLWVQYIRGQPVYEYFRTSFEHNSSAFYENSSARCWSFRISFLTVMNISFNYIKYKGVSRSFRTGRLERELQMVELCATTCSCIAISWVSLVSFAAITLCVASQRIIPK